MGATFRVRSPVYANLTSPDQIAEVLNAVGEYLESTEPPPDHWDETKRTAYYAAINKQLTAKTQTALTKLLQRTV